MGVDLDGAHLVKVGTECPHLYQVQFSGQGQRKTLALDAQGAGELLCLVPGSEVSVDLRRRAVDVVLRVEGGDESLVDRIQANRKFQANLKAHDPNHPLRAVGEHAERRQAEDAALPEEAQRRAEMELALNHKKRMLDLEYEEKQLELIAKRAAIEAAKKKSELDEERMQKKAQMEERQKQEELHEEFRRQRACTISANLEALRVLHPEKRQPLSPRSLRAVEDELRTGLLGRERGPISCWESRSIAPVSCKSSSSSRTGLRGSAPRSSGTT